MLVKLLLIVLLQVVLAKKQKEYYDVDNNVLVRSLFELFLEKHNKHYHGIEKYRRMNIFHKTLKEINKLNEDHPETIFGITFFADLTHEEKQRYKGFRPNAGDLRVGPCSLQGGLPSHDAPPSLDWRDKGAVTPVQNQQNCGSCWAFSATATVESQYALKYGQQVDLSEQQLVDCDHNSFGCNGGMPTNAFSNLIASGGQERENDYTYSAHVGTCQFDSNKVAVKVASCTSFSLNSEDALKEILAKYGPLSIIVDAEPYSSYHGGVLTNCTLNSLDHAVQLVGYGTEEGGSDYWIVKNSWGTTFGEDGFIRVKRGVNCNGLLNPYISSVTVA